MKRLLAVFLCVACIGCGGELQQAGSVRLPTNAKVIENLGNGWSVVEFRVDGKTRKFVYRYYSQGNATTEVLAELSDAVPTAEKSP